MNERIKELCRQASDQTSAEFGSSNFRQTEWESLFREKFAMLIIKECITQARSEEDRFYGIGEDDLALTMEHFQEVLKHHFNVIV